MTRYIAFDLGASNGRCVLGHFDGERLCLDVAHRFENHPMELMGHLHWDILNIYQNIKLALHSVCRQDCRDIVSLGLDTWGCDYALLDREGKLLGNPFCYRDPQTNGMFAEVFKHISREEIFAQTGLQFMELNTLFQLMALKVRDDPLLAAAATFLHIPDLLHYWLSGAKVCEYTNATTSHLLDARTRGWAFPLIARVGLPQHIFPEIVPPATALGPLRRALVEEVGLGHIQVIATATHDTAAAIVAIPAQAQDFAYISSGTWGLLGQEIDQPLLSAECMRLNLTNEGGAFNKITFLRNIVNLWLVQECRHYWSLQGERLNWADLIQLAGQAQPFTAYIDPDDPVFILPGNMPERIQRHCQKSGQPVPQSAGEILRVILESLAFKYRYTLDRVQAVSGKPVAHLHIIGGGSQNELLNQFSANAIQRPVIAGPAEATAIGNILIQMVASGALESLGQARALVRRSFPTSEFFPRDGEVWEEQYHGYVKKTGLPLEI